MAGEPLTWVIVALQTTTLALLGWAGWWLRGWIARRDERPEPATPADLEEALEGVERRLDMVLSQLLHLGSRLREAPARGSVDADVEKASANHPKPPKEPLEEQAGIHEEAPEPLADRDGEGEEVLELPATPSGAAVGTAPSGNPAASAPARPEEDPPDKSHPAAGSPNPLKGMASHIHSRSLSLDSDAPVNRLQKLLNDSDFRDAVWHRMDGPFDQAARHLVDHLTRNGMAEPKVAPYPEITWGQLNHWRMMVVASQEPGSDATRVLVPRHYDRYDPTLHQPLFILQGNPAAADKHLRELRRCVLLRAQGDLGQGVAPDLVLEKGIVVV